MSGYFIPMGLARQEARRIFPDTATITPPTKVASGRGASVITYDPLNAKQFNCMITESRPRVYEQFGNTVKPGTLFKLRLPFGTVVDPESQIVINGSTYKMAKPSVQNSYQVSEGIEVILQI